MAEDREPAGADPADSLTRRSSLRVTKSAFEEHMREEDFTENTIKAFESDLNILMEFIGAWTAVGEISTSDLNRRPGCSGGSQARVCAPARHPI